MCRCGGERSSVARYPTLCKVRKGWGTRGGVSGERCGGADTPISKCERSGAPAFVARWRRANTEVLHCVQDDESMGGVSFCKNEQLPKRSRWLKGSSGVLGLGVWQVLRLRSG